MSDGNPERRNLVLLSMAIIIFYIADGEIIDSSLRLQFINIQFNNFQILSSVVWMILFWFLFRYRLTTLGIFEKEFKSEFSDVSRQHPILAVYINNFLTDYTQDYGHNQRNASISLYRNKNMDCYAYISGIKLKSSPQSKENHQSPIKSPLGWLLLIIILANTAIVRPSFSAYIIPYLIFLTAIASPLIF